ncbi:MAG: hypothetical protein QOH50_5061 [Kribbellaceae bacterium]|nr:hypothetical protein [Kribbellaceae bacterium]
MKQFHLYLEDRYIFSDFQDYQNLLTAFGDTQAQEARKARQRYLELEALEAMVMDLQSHVDNL